MLTIIQTSRFKKDMKRAKKRGYDFSEFKAVVQTLARGEELHPKYKDHPLKGEWEGCRDCHLAFDWVLIYAVDEEASELVLIRTGSHADLFE